MRQHVATWPDVEQAKVNTLLRRAKEGKTLVKAGARAYDVAESWLHNVDCIQSGTAPFDGVTVSRKSAGKYPSLEDWSWDRTAAEWVPAKAEHYARAAQTLVYAAPELHFIDPYLNPCDSDRSKVLQAMLGNASRERCQSVHVWVREDRLNRSPGETLGALVGLARSAGMQSGTALRLNVFNDAGTSVKVHDRYLLSIHGAIRFEHGFHELAGNREAKVEPQSSANTSDCSRSSLRAATICVSIRFRPTWHRSVRLFA